MARSINAQPQGRFLYLRSVRDRVVTYSRGCSDCHHLGDWRLNKPLAFLERRDPIAQISIDGTAYTLR
jgi:hypothetical protein